MNEEISLTRLDRLQLERLMFLAFEAARLAQAFDKALVVRYQRLAARCGFELWSREQRGLHRTAFGVFYRREPHH